MATEVRGGFPQAKQFTIVDGSVGDLYHFTQPINELHVTNLGGVDVQVYFTLDNFDNDLNSVTVLAGTRREFPAAISDVWLRSNGFNTPVELVGFARRG